MRKTLLELFNQVRGIIQDPGHYNLDPDIKWFEDLNNRRDLHRKHPDAFMDYNSEQDIPNFPIMNRDGKLSLKLMLRSLAQAMMIQSQNPTATGIDDIVHKLQKIIIDYRDDLDEIPSYRMPLVKTGDLTQSLNNLVYGPKQPIDKLALLVKDLVTDPAMDLERSQDIVKPPDENRVNVPQGKNPYDMDAHLIGLETGSEINSYEKQDED